MKTRLKQHIHRMKDNIKNLKQLKKERDNALSGLARLSEGFNNLQTGFLNMQAQNEHLLSQNTQLSKEIDLLTSCLRCGDSALAESDNTEGEIFAAYDNELIIFNTLPKSGSVYIANSLAKGLNATLGNISNGYFPCDSVNYFRLAALVGGNYIVQEHLDASPQNVQLLEALIDKIVVHVRDPRQATLSWTHHLSRLFREGKKDMLNYAFPSPPSSYYSDSLKSQLDWTLENHLPLTIKWIQDWIQVAEKGRGLQVLLTDYGDFLRDNTAFIAKILEYFDFAEEKFHAVVVEKNMNHNFRKGDPNEWREVFSKEQVNKATQLIPRDLFDRFNWLP